MALVEAPAPLAKSLKQPADDFVDLAGPKACQHRLSRQLAEATVKSRLTDLQKTVPILPVGPEDSPLVQTTFYHLSQIYWLNNVLDFAEKIDRTSGLFYDPGRDRLSVANSLPPLMTLRSQTSCDSEREVLVVDLNEDHDLWSFLVST